MDIIFNVAQTTKLWMISDQKKYHGPVTFIFLSWSLTIFRKKSVMISRNFFSGTMCNSRLTLPD